MRVYTHCLRVSHSSIDHLSPPLNYSQYSCLSHVHLQAHVPSLPYAFCVWYSYYNLHCLVHDNHCCYKTGPTELTTHNAPPSFEQFMLGVVALLFTYGGESTTQKITSDMMLNHYRNIEPTQPQL